MSTSMDNSLKEALSKFGNFFLLCLARSAINCNFAMSKIRIKLILDIKDIRWMIDNIPSLPQCCNHEDSYCSAHKGYGSLKSSRQT